MTAKVLHDRRLAVVETARMERETKDREREEYTADTPMITMANPNGRLHKYAYQVYKDTDTEQEEKYTGFAKNIIGISDWIRVIKNRQNNCSTRN